MSQDIETIKQRFVSVRSATGRLANDVWGGLYAGDQKTAKAICDDLDHAAELTQGTSQIHRQGER